MPHSTTNSTIFIYLHYHFQPISSPCYGFLNKRVRYAIESATAMYPIIVLKLAMVEATNG